MIRTPNTKGVPMQGYRNATSLFVEVFMKEQLHQFHRKM
jgi:hypothetical protein